jgi:hypothetical protein
LHVKLGNKLTIYAPKILALLRTQLSKSTGDESIHGLAGWQKSWSLRSAPPIDLLCSVSPELQLQKKIDGKRSPSLCFAACTSRRTEKAFFPVKKDRRPATALI